MKIFKKWSTPILIFGLIITGTCFGQDVKIDHSVRFINHLVSVSPKLSEGGGILLGLGQEWSRLGKHYSVFVSADYETRINRFQTINLRYNAYYIRPGIRYYYKINSTGLFHGYSLLFAYEERPMPWKSALSYGNGLSIIGYRHIFNSNLILEADGFLGFGLAHITEYDGNKFMQGRFFSIFNLRIGYHFNKIKHQ